MMPIFFDYKLLNKIHYRCQIQAAVMIAVMQVFITCSFI